MKTRKFLFISCTEAHILAYIELFELLKRGKALRGWQQ